MRDPLRITFILPGSGHHPVGGFKVVYEYANGLSRRGHQVTVVHPSVLNRDASLMTWSKGLVRYVQRRLDGSFRPSSWFQVEPAVQMMWVPSLAERHIPNGDVVIATAWQTAEWVAEYSPSKGRKFYLIQHQETWSGPEERVMNTWRLPLRKIVIARWLQNIAEQMGETAEYIPNGLDFEAFGMDIPPEHRDGCRVMMLYHNYDWKGSRDGLRALEIVKESQPDLHVTLFGVPARPAGLPSWIEYFQNPPQQVIRRLYNEAAVFLAPSWSEGWPLPPAEAMMCGAVLIATDIGGHREYALDGETALLVPPRDPPAIADRLLRLLVNPTLRIDLAYKGHRFIQQFTWWRSVDALERYIFRSIGLGESVSEKEVR